MPEDGLVVAGKKIARDTTGARLYLMDLLGLSESQAAGATVVIAYIVGKAAGVMEASEVLMDPNVDTPVVNPG